MIGLLSAALVAAAPAVAASAGAAPAPSRAEPPRVLLVGSAQRVVGLPEHVLDLLGDWSGVEIVRAERLRPEHLFWRAERDPDRTTGWVFLEDDATAAICAAGPGGRPAMVFRTIAVGVPLTELDRERIGQALRSALLTVSEAEQPPPPGPSPPAAQPSPPQSNGPPAAAAQVSDAVTTPVARAAAHADTPAAALNLGASYSLEGSSAGLRHAVGLLATAELGRWTRRPGIWLEGTYFLPSSASDSGFTARLFGKALRVGVGAALHPRLSAGVGVGVEYVDVFIPATNAGPGAESESSARVYIGRMFARYRPTMFGAVRASIAAVVDFASAPVQEYRPMAQVGPVRAGLSLALWLY